MQLSPETSGPVQTKQVGYGLPCANCRAYYPADLEVCPICGSRERIPASGGDVRCTRPIVNTQAKLPRDAALQ